MHQNVVWHIRILGLENPDDRLDEVYVHVAQARACHVHKQCDLIVRFLLQPLHPVHDDAQEILLVPALRVLLDANDQQGLAVPVLVVGVDGTIGQVLLVQCLSGDIVDPETLAPDQIVPQPGVGLLHVQVVDLQQFGDPDIGVIQALQIIGVEGF